VSDISLDDFLKLYRTPSLSEDPAVANRTALRRISSQSGAAFPLVRTQGVLTTIIKAEKDGDFHFYVETERSQNQPDTPMATCEIQGLAAPGDETDPRIPGFKQLASEAVEIYGIFRAWPEHLRDSTQPHLFEIHPVLTIGRVGENPIDFFDRVIWPTGEDENEPSRTFRSAFGPPMQLSVKRRGNRIVFATPSHNMKKENYIHVDAFCIGEVVQRADWAIAMVAEKADLQNPVQCLALRGTPAFGDFAAMQNGVQYRIGGLCGLNIPALLGANPTWQAQLCPILSVEEI